MCYIYLFIYAILKMSRFDSEISRGSYPVNISEYPTVALELVGFVRI